MFDFIRNLTIYKCPECEHWYFDSRKLRLVHHRVAGWIRICQDCYVGIYGYGGHNAS